ncbi:glutamine amidotransferase [Psychromonas sp. psych-6C06]|uniref:DJ-1/PfpI family protein n=1 Tax=Psychromonas sp. psych-6C06 TaxID=2058089 RepID=UPI000C3465F4|nr:DJ-1/PfpI family protein [Psychromonas sp. psych-6C06]PKF63002.1 glutamine amidotransferase [Psychromonas sp. psych-6C06]
MNIGIYIYENAEVLDFSGPFEVLSTAKRLASNDWSIALIAESDQPVKARGGFWVTPDYCFDNHPLLDLLIVVGGVHTEEVKKANVIKWIANCSATTTKTVSVCTGAFLLAEAGLLDGVSVTTHWEDIADLRSGYPQLKVRENKRWVCDGKYITSGGISAGIDMSLHLLSDLSSMALAEQTAKQMEYNWNKNS